VNSETAIVAVDVGNSAAKFAVRRGVEIVDHAIRIDTAGWEQLAVAWVREQLADRDRRWRIASVRGSATDRLRAAIGHLDAPWPCELITRHDVPIHADVDHPDRVGIDRLLGAYAATRRVGSPVVVVDAGSAVTIDWINREGRFCGGAILPGLRLQSRALATGTEALPQIDWRANQEIRLPARNTTEAIRSGILAGLAATIDALIERYWNAGGDGPIRAVLTGGDCPAISPHLRHPHQCLPHMVCRELLDLPRSMVTPTTVG
jgi:type III pantothenate kinase